jgi:hypothetical protein
VQSRDDVKTVPYVGRQREEAVRLRAQRSHPAGGWVLGLGWLPSSVLILYALSVAGRGRKEEWWKTVSLNLPPTK